MAVTTAGRYVTLDRVVLDWPPAPAPAMFAGAVGPRSLRLCGEVADGTIPTTGTSPDGVRRARRLIDEGRVAGGRNEPHPITVYLLAATGPGAAARLQADLRSWGGDPAQVGVAGDERTVAAAVHRWAAAGADTVVLQPTVDPEGFVHFVARDVRPLVR